MKAVLHWLSIALGIVFLLFLAYVQRERAFKGQNDFVSFYVAGKLVGTPELYSRPANEALIRSTLGFSLENVTYIRPPFYAVFFKPLALLPYRVAYTLFSLATLASVLWFVIKFARDCSALPFFAAMSIPTLTAICGGQDTPFLLAFLGASILLTRAKKDIPAGLVLSLIAIKFHLFLFVPILLLVKRRWQILGGALTGLVSLTLIGCLVAGGESLWQYVNVLRDPWINPSATIMPNLHGLVAVLNGGTTLELLFVALVLAAFTWVVLRSDNYEFLLAASLVCGLLVSFHSGVPDDIILLPVFVGVAQTCSMPSLRTATALILTPVPYFMVLADAPYSAFLPLSLLVIVGLFCMAVGEGFRKAAISQASYAS
jgi:hypothetical protein